MDPIDPLLPYDTAGERRGWRKGVKVAKSVIAESNATDLEDLVEHYGLDVRVDDWQGLDGLVLLGTYNGGRITVYRHSIEAHAKQYGIPDTQVRDAVLAHELGHFLYHEDLTENSRAFVRSELLSRIVSTKSRRDPKPVREAAANGFAVEVLRTQQTYELPVLVEILTSLGKTKSITDSNDKSEFG